MSLQNQPSNLQEQFILFRFLALVFLGPKPERAEVSKGGSRGHWVKCLVQNEKCAKSAL